MIIKRISSFHKPLYVFRLITIKKKIYENPKKPKCPMSV